MEVKLENRESLEKKKSILEKEITFSEIIEKISSLCRNVKSGILMILNGTAEISEILHKNFLNDTDCIVVYEYSGPKLEIIFANNKYLEITGYSFEELKQGNPTELLYSWDEEIYKKVKNDVKNVGISGKGYLENIYPLKSKNGDLISMSWNNKNCNFRGKSYQVRRGSTSLAEKQLLISQIIKN